MRYVFSICVMLFLAGCNYWSTALSGMHKIGTVLWDDRTVEYDFTDTVLNVNLRNELIQYDPKLGLDVEITVFKGDVLLTGAIPSVEVITNILEIVWKEKGVKKVYNYLRIAEPLDLLTVQEDAFIPSLIRTQLAITDKIKSANYKLTMENKVIYIMGQKESKEELEKVFSVIKATPGVEKIISLIDE